MQEDSYEINEELAKGIVERLERILEEDGQILLNQRQNIRRIPRETLQQLLIVQSTPMTYALFPYSQQCVICFRISIPFSHHYYCPVCMCMLCTQCSQFQMSMTKKRHAICPFTHQITTN